MNIIYKKKYLKYKYKYLNLQNNFIGGGNKKPVNKKPVNKKNNSINDIISKKNVLEYYKKNYSMNNLLYEQLSRIYEITPYYKNVKSNMQIKTLVNSAKKQDDFDIINRLILILGRDINSYKKKKILKLLTHNLDDDKIYEKLVELERIFPRYKPNYFKNKFNRKAEIMAKWILSFLSGHTDIDNLKNKKYKKNLSKYKWLDFGCGSGNKTRAIQRFLKLNKENVYTADIYEWFNYGRERKLPFNFIRIKPNKPLPIEKNKFDIVTMIMVLHHVKNLYNLLSEMNRIIKKGGGIYLIEHDCFTDADKMLVDIEHAMYEKQNVNFKDKYYSKTFSYLERRILLENFGFELKWYRLFHENINDTITPTRACHELYVKVKDL